MLTTLDRLNVSSYRFNVEIAEKMQEICQPLFTHFNFTDFGYVKLFRDGRMLRVSTGKEWTKHYFERQYYNDPVFYNFDTIPDNSAEIRIITNQPQGGVYTELYDHNIWNIFTRYERTGDTAQVWFFATERDNIEILDFYFNRQHIIDKFIAYFKKRAAPFLIPHHDILISTELKLRESEKQEEAKIKRFLGDIGRHNPKLKVSFSPREKECLRYLLMGKSAKEIARVLQISYRTVEFHINHIKQKVGCKKLAGLMTVVFERGLQGFE